VRRSNLPWDRSASPHRPCDAIVGRFCYWNDSLPETPPPEPVAISEARATLIASLRSAASENPADGWISGQLVRYLIEAGEAIEAVDAARACATDRWWCLALEGLALHVSQRYPTADSIYKEALRLMPSGVRCDWTDPAPVLDGKIARELSGIPCAERDSAAAVLWKLAQPLWRTGGNDFATELYARATMAAIVARTPNAHGMTWSDDSRELMLRYGWPEWYTRTEQPPYMSAMPTVTGHDRQPSYAVVPAVESVRGLPRVTESMWRLHEQRASARYAPRHLTSLAALEHQLVRVPRGDSILIAIAYRATDSILARDRGAAVMLSAYDGRDVVFSSASRDNASLTVRKGTYVVSAEVVDTSGRAERARYTVDSLPCATWCLSDILLFVPSDSTPATFGDALAQAVPYDHLRAGAPIGVFWTVDGLAAPASGRTSVTMTPVRVGRLRRFAARLHMAPSITPVQVQWQSSLLRTSVSDAVVLRLPPSARGHYRIDLTVQPTNQRPLSVSREVYIER